MKHVMTSSSYPWSLRKPFVSSALRLDQHRGQISCEWIDTDTGEVQRTGVAPAGRAAVQGFLQRSGRQQLDVALQGTTGWRCWSRSCAV